MKKVLLSTVCGPFGINSDDCTEHVMPELFHAQVTRSQSIFSVRAPYISYGLEYIAANIKAPTTVLQYPTMKQFIRELKKGYDYVGINFVIATFEKLKKMTQAVRQISPGSKIILGGYGTMLPECEQYGDHICREEGAEYMRKLLGEPADDAPKKHVTYPTRSRIAGFPATKGAVVLAGLGCPHGCEFCATSHFHKQKHIPLLKTGQDLYQEIRRVHKTLNNPTTPVGLMEEDFLMQRKRAEEFLECVKKDTKDPIRISCFSSAFSVSQWDPKDLVRMGIEAIWIGVESMDASYSKLKGIDVKSVFESLHSHGINTLASLILGHDFHTVKKVWEDFEYLTNMRPTLSQFLILTSACTTPLYNRLKKEDRLLKVPYTHWDGFHLVFKHPHIGKEELEQLLLEVYDKEYQKLGPSAIRYVERQLEGYKRFKNSSDSLLRLRAEQFKKECANALPLFPTAAHHAPTKEIADWVRNLHKAIIAEVGSGGIGTKLRSAIVPVLARVEQFRLENFGYSQVSLRRTEYRMQQGQSSTKTAPAAESFSIKPQPHECANHPLVLDLHGVLDKMTASGAGTKIEDYLKKHCGQIAINFKGVTRVEGDTLMALLKRLIIHKDRVKIISIHAIQTDVADVVVYARSYFEVFMDMEGLANSLTVA